MSGAARLLTLVCVAMLVVGSAAAFAPVATAADLQPAVQCGFAAGDPVPTTETVRHGFGEVVVGRTGETTVAARDWTAGDDASVFPVGGPDAGQFQVASGEAATEPIRLSFAPTTPGTKRAWVVVDGEAGPTVHCLVGTAIVAGASKSGRGGDGSQAGRGGVGSAGGDAAGGGGGGVTDVFRGFGRELVGSVTRGVVSVVTLEFARDAAVGAGAAWAAGEGLGGKALNLVGYTLSGIDPTAGLRRGLPAALAAWRVGDFEGAGRALFGVVESVVFTGAAAAGAYEGSKRARQFTRDRRGAATSSSNGPQWETAPSAAEYRAFSTDMDRVLSSGLGSDRAGRTEGDGSADRARSDERPPDHGDGDGHVDSVERGAEPDTGAESTAERSDRDDRRELA